MSIGSWDPSTAKQSAALQIEHAVLKRFIAFGHNEQLDALDKHLSADEQALYAKLMTMAPEAWAQASEALTDDDMYQLMRFFTVAEMQLPGWEAEDKSPVIWLHKLLKKAGKPLSKEQVMWIKQHTRNRFLPNGPALL